MEHHQKCIIYCCRLLNSCSVWVLKRALHALTCSIAVSIFPTAHKNSSSFPPMATDHSSPHTRFIVSFPLRASKITSTLAATLECWTRRRPSRSQAKVASVVTVPGVFGMPLHDGISIGLLLNTK
jgi:hypothetical protein